ncbi:hypothetical protein I6G82_08145 [Lysinibacillus macroides]|uniref:Uncharacterized protein n=1 Tax=Lysinibacillus macroides TaxID=33935 RepID=A0A0N0UWJ4_9BACI|nr:DUF3221 domain-containing protein [Lysinibacillus macroides]KOY81611.1 hypothetical protein ADM90_14550 [Lysinibacillus macroides]QPR69543.1 hypothetical protein I6G82_08145 [Lysinibacillus macroides]
MSKVDIRVLRNLSDSKKRVITNVMQHLEQRHEKKSSKRWQYRVLTMILSVCIGLFIYHQYKDAQQASMIPPVLDEQMLELALQSDAKMNGKNRLYRYSFDSFLMVESAFVYAQSQGLAPTQSQIAKKLEEVMDSFHYGELTLSERLSMLQMSEEAFIESYAKPIAYKAATGDLLWDATKADYPHTSDQVRMWFVEQEAMAYLEQHYHRELASLREKYKIPEKFGQATYTRSGMVVALKEYEFLVVSGASASDLAKLSVDEIVQKHTNGTWFPLVKAPKKLSVGDQVEVQYRKAIGGDAQSFIEFKDTIGIKIVEEY